MRTEAGVAASVCFILSFLSARGEEAAAAASKLPEGGLGIAAKYPGDEGIEKDRRILFAEKFDQPSRDLMFARWETVSGKAGMKFSKDTPAGSADSHSLQMTHVGGESTGSQLYRRLPSGHDRVFARFYVKMDRECAAIHHFGTHLGGFNPSTPWPQGGAGEKPDGTKRFTTGVEPYGNKWEWDFYTYWQGMRRHGDGRFWGTPFLSGTEKPAVRRGRWICVEMMVKMNRPSTAANGEQAFWIDGKLWRVNGQIVSHIGPGFPKGVWTGGWWSPGTEAESAFKGFRWRTDDALGINYLWTYLYITKAPAGHVSRVWFDNIVVSTAYIGPIEPLAR